MGPWKVAWHGNGSQQLPIYGADGVEVAVLTKGHLGDARLIAAAPDLLAALKEARDMLTTASRYMPKSIKHQDRFGLLNVLANSVEPAIAKAEGRAGG